MLTYFCFRESGQLYWTIVTVQNFFLQKKSALNVTKSGSSESVYFDLLYNTTFEAYKYGVKALRFYADLPPWIVFTKRNIVVETISEPIGIREFYEQKVHNLVISTKHFNVNLRHAVATQHNDNMATLNFDFCVRCSHVYSSNIVLQRYCERTDRQPREKFS